MPKLTPTGHMSPAALKDKTTISLFAGRKFTDGDRTGRSMLDDKGQLCMRYDDEQMVRPLTTEIVMRSEWDVPQSAIDALSEKSDSQAKASTTTNPIVLVAMARVKAKAEASAKAVVDAETAKQVRIAELKSVGASAGGVHPARAVPAEHADRVAELRALGKAVS